MKDFMCVKGKVEVEEEVNGEKKSKIIDCPGREMGAVDGFRGDAPVCPICDTPMEEIPGISGTRWKWNDDGMDTLKYYDK